MAIYMRPIGVPGDLGVRPNVPAQREAKTGGPDLQKPDPKGDAFLAASINACTRVVPVKDADAIALEKYIQNNHISEPAAKEFLKNARGLSWGDLKDDYSEYAKTDPKNKDLWKQGLLKAYKALIKVHHVESLQYENPEATRTELLHIYFATLGAKSPDKVLSVDQYSDPSFETAFKKCDKTGSEYREFSIPLKGYELSSENSVKDAYTQWCQDNKLSVGDASNPFGHLRDFYSYRSGLKAIWEKCKGDHKEFEKLVQSCRAWGENTDRSIVMIGQLNREVDLMKGDLKSDMQRSVESLVKLASIMGAKGDLRDTATADKLTDAERAKLKALEEKAFSDDPKGLEEFLDYTVSLKEKYRTDAHVDTRVAYVSRKISENPQGRQVLADVAKRNPGLMRNVLRLFGKSGSNVLSEGFYSAFSSAFMSSSEFQYPITELKVTFGSSFQEVADISLAIHLILAEEKQRVGVRTVLAEYHQWMAELDKFLKAKIEEAKKTDKKDLVKFKEKLASDIKQFCVRLEKVSPTNGKELKVEIDRLKEKLVHIVLAATSIEEKSL